MKQPLISEAQRREFDERGFFVLDAGFDPADIAMLRAECMRSWQHSLTETAGTGAYETQRLRPFLPSLHASSSEVARFTRHPVFVELARTLVGRDVDQVWNQACLKFPDEGGATEFPFHQDWQFSTISKVQPNFSCFVALVPLSAANGTLHFATRTGDRRLDHVRNLELGWWQCSVDGYEVVPGVLEPGQMIVYHVLTPHGSPPNRTEAAREAFVVSFGVPGQCFESGEPFGDQRPLLRGGELVPG